MGTTRLAKSPVRCHLTPSMTGSLFFIATASFVYPLPTPRPLTQSSPDSPSGTWGICNNNDLYMESGHILQGSFSAVSRPIFVLLFVKDRNAEFCELEYRDAEFCELENRNQETARILARKIQRCGPS